MHPLLRSTITSKNIPITLDFFFLTFCGAHRELSRNLFPCRRIQSGSRLFNQRGVISTRTDLMELDPSANSLLSFRKRESRMTSRLPPAITPPHMSILLLSCVNLVTPTCWGNFTAFTWWAAISFAGRVNSWGALGNIHGCQATKAFYTVCVSIHVKNVHTWVCVWLCTMCKEGKNYKKHTEM